MELSEMTTAQLRDLSEKIGLELNRRIEELHQVRRKVLENTQQYEFEFEAELRREKPYVAECYWDRGLERRFKPLAKEGTAAAGKYTAHEGEILDIRDNEGRSYYIVYNGELKELGSSDMDVVRIKLYLKGQIDKQAFLEIMGIEETNSEVLDDLRDDDNNN